MRIENCTERDVPEIHSLYQAARDLQTKRKTVVWPFFESDFILNEIRKNLQWKLVIDDIIMCNWAIAFSDKDIWGEKDLNDAIYIHRIATNPNFRGQNWVSNLVTWAKEFGKNHNKAWVRLDTLGNNTKLIEHYESSGFTFLGIQRLINTQNLPAHYQKEPNCCYFELAI